MLFRTDYTIYTLPTFDRVTVSVRLSFNVQIIKYRNSMIFKKFAVSEFTSPWVIQYASYPVRDLADWFVGELSCKQLKPLTGLQKTSVSVLRGSNKKAVFGFGNRRSTKFVTGDKFTFWGADWKPAQRLTNWQIVNYYHRCFIQWRRPTSSGRHSCCHHWDLQIWNILTASTAVSHSLKCTTWQKLRTSTVQIQSHL